MKLRKFVDFVASWMILCILHKTGQIYINFMSCEINFCNKSCYTSKLSRQISFFFVLEENYIHYRSFVFNEESSKNLFSFLTKTKIRKDIQHANVYKCC